MTGIEKKKILIVGSSAKEYALAKRLSNENAKVYAASGTAAMSEFCTVADIREDNAQELLEFVLENAVDLTVVSSNLAIKSDIVSLFQSNNQLIFAPSAKSAEAVIKKSICKKFLYKLHIHTPRFGVFEKQQIALDYLKTARFPLIVSADENYTGSSVICNSIPSARTFIDDLFTKGEDKVIIDEYTYGHPFTFYAVCDGYGALPIVSVSYDHPGGVGAFAPDYKVSENVENSLMNKVVSNILTSLERKGAPYTGILGVDCILTNDDSYVVTNLRTFFSDSDCRAVLNLTDENIISLFEACANGSFADDYEKISINGMFSASYVLGCGKSFDKAIVGLDLADECDIDFFNNKMSENGEYLTNGEKTLVITKTAKTLSRAIHILFEEKGCIK